MANLIQHLTRRTGTRDDQRASPWPLITLDDYIAESFGYQGLDYGVVQSPSTVTLTQGNTIEEIGSDFRGYVDGVYKRNGVVFACVTARMLIFSEARFQWRQRVNGVPGNLFGTNELARLERPWPNATTGDLLARMLLDVDLCGNAYVARRGGGLRLMRPDWVTIILGSRTRLDRRLTADDLDADVIGYAYHPGGVQAGTDPEILLADDVAHFAPLPDPAARFRGMSWITPVVREIQGDSAATSHKLSFFSNAATPNLAIVGKNLTLKQAQAIQDALYARHAGVANAYESLVLGGVDDVKVVGADMRQISFKETQGHGETRICAAARVPAIIAGVSEGLDASTYSNFEQAKKHWADGTIRPLWRNVAASLQTILDVPNAGAELWYDDRDIPFLKDDITARAAVNSQDAGTINTLISAGFNPDDAVDAVTAGDLSRLRGKHTGLVSVQLQEPGAQDQPGAPPANGTVPSAPAVDGQNGRRTLEQFVREG
jgi:phage portal protein BeeE